MIDEDDNEDNDNEYEKVIHQKTTKQTSYKGPMTRSRKNDTGLTNTGKLLFHGGQGRNGVKSSALRKVTAKLGKNIRSRKAELGVSLNKMGISKKREVKLMRTKNENETELGVMDKDESNEKVIRKVNGRIG